jgi:hypothetical protein
LQTAPSPEWPRRRRSGLPAPFLDRPPKPVTTRRHASDEWMHRRHVVAHALHSLQRAQGPRRLDPWLHWFSERRRPCCTPSPSFC